MVVNGEGATRTGTGQPVLAARADHRSDDRRSVAKQDLSSGFADVAPDSPEGVAGPGVATTTERWYQRSFSFGKPVKPEALMAFARQLASFLEAGIPVLEALEIVSEETASDPMRIVIDEMRESVMRGVGFAASAQAQPKVFPSYFQAMLVSAEYTGHLDVVLAQLADYLERDIAAKRQIKSALTYPVVVLVIAVIAMVVMSIFVLPKFSGLYRNLGAELPLPTRMLLGFTDFITGQWPVLVGVAALGWGIGMALFGGTRSKVRRDRLAMRLPVIGALFHLISIERFCRVLSSLVVAGIPLPDAITVSAESTNNSMFISKLAVVRDVLIRGGGLTEPIVESELFPTAARQMIRVGERTGMLGQQLGKAATYYERDVELKMKRATDLFEPIVILVVGLAVGFVAVAQVAAMYSIFGQVQ